MKPFITAAATIVAALFLSSCTSPASDGHTDHAHDSESSAAVASASPAPNNAADLTFVTGMIPHHEQAVQMSALVAQRSTNPSVTTLAADISAAQGPEIQTMKALLAQWGGDAHSSGHQGHEGMEMQGMVDDSTMAKLASLNGADFDQLWLQSMIGHHEGAIAMARTEIADGANADAKTLATQIVTAQQAEIGQMKQMLGG
ncbi:DUF305 domain-containing protein [Mycolicibacterium sp.]|uniref:DUF305 domain-containing protein n=1 Tax=Mycolicibacterium sp. TaxID=2320850 RepID=UPI001A249580|nr:DUF305 domain-containing protein [Mycolicibacterium sp.]MBJ7340076.1 DUF305 domain-containing protein [Mycolicibacterium sp.]